MIVHFYIDASGRTTDIEFFKGINPILNPEAARIIREALAGSRGNNMARLLKSE